MSTTSSDRLRRVLRAVAISVVVLIGVLAFARCSSPSTITTGLAGGDASTINAAAIAMAHLTAWQQETPTLVQVRQLGAHSVVVTARYPTTGEHVEITAEHNGTTWHTPYPPRPAAAPATQDWPQLPTPDPVTAEDARWATATGFLRAWLTGQPTDRWTSTKYQAQPLPVKYSNYEITGALNPMPVPNSPVQVITIEYTASPDTDLNSRPRPYRTYIAVHKDQTGRWTVTAVAYQPPESNP
ncbi:MAG: hypothetical protein OXM57_14315 [bacterium]|nr:hypothetical protein [bacterium]